MELKHLAKYLYDVESKLVDCGRNMGRTLAVTSLLEDYIINSITDGTELNRHTLLDSIRIIKDIDESTRKIIEDDLEFEVSDTIQCIEQLDESMVIIDNSIDSNSKNNNNEA